MKKIKTITYLSALGLFGTCAAISTSSCKPNDINVKLLSLSSDGVADKTDSATLTLSITSLISDLVAKNITIKNNTEASRIIKADKILSESGQQYEFSIVGTWNEGDEIQIRIKKDGYNITGNPSTILHKKTSTPVKLLKIEGNGQTNTEDTTQLTLTTDVSILDLKNGDIKLINKTQTDKMITADEMLGWENNQCQFTIKGTWVEGDEVEITIKKEDYVFTGNPTTTLHKFTTSFINLESLSANGKKDEEITTQLTLVTNADINDLSSSDVTIKNISESTFLQATNVSGNHNGYQININGNWNEGDKVELSISKTGYTFTGTPSTTLHKPIVSINLLTLEANGKANEVETTQLSLTTSGSILDLLVEDVTLVNLTLSNRTIRCSNVSIGFDAKILISVFGDWDEGDEAQITLKKNGYIFNNSLNTKLHEAKKHY